MVVLKEAPRLLYQAMDSIKIRLLIIKYTLAIIPVLLPKLPENKLSVLPLYMGIILIRLLKNLI